MAGHSKWANIKHKKAKMDAQKGKVFTRLAREITVAAREGGGDPAGNARLRLLMDKARAANMPQDNITRAIKKGTGELEGASYESMTYEGYAPAGVAVMVEVLTDNKNRAVAAVRHVFSKYGGNLGESGAVNWMFERKGLVIIEQDNISEDDVVDALLEHDVDDVTSEDHIFRVTCDSHDLESVNKAAQDAGFNVTSAEVTFIPQNYMDLEESETKKVYTLLEALDDLDDVQNVYANIK